jgi:hypothetical protein
MEFRRPTADELRLLQELARIAGMPDPDRWLDGLSVREMNDGGMGSLELGARSHGGTSGLVVPKASLQFAYEDGVALIVMLNVDASGVPFELDIWKTDFSPVRRIPSSFERPQG